MVRQAAAGRHMWAALCVITALIAASTLIVLGDVSADTRPQALDPQDPESAFIDQWVPSEDGAVVRVEHSSSIARAIGASPGLVNATFRVPAGALEDPSFLEEFGYLDAQPAQGASIHFADGEVLTLPPGSRMEVDTGSREISSTLSPGTVIESPVRWTDFGSPMGHTITSASSLDGEVTYFVDGVQVDASNAERLMAPEDPITPVPTFQPQD